MHTRAWARTWKRLSPAKLAFSSNRKDTDLGSEALTYFEIMISFWFDKATPGNFKRCLFVFRRTSLWGPLRQSGWCVWGEGQQQVLLMMQDVFVKPGPLERPGSGEDAARRRPTGTSYQEGTKAPTTTNSTATTPHLVAWVRVRSVKKGSSTTVLNGLKELEKKHKWVRMS